MFLRSGACLVGESGRKEMQVCLLFSVCVQLIEIRMEASYCNVVSLPCPNPLQM